MRLKKPSKREGHMGSTLVKYSCQDCEFMLKDKLQIYKCLKPESGDMGFKETHPLWPVCAKFSRKNISDVPMFKAERLY